MRRAQATIDAGTPGADVLRGERYPPPPPQDARPLPELLALADSLRGPIVAVASARVCRAAQFDACIAVLVRIGTPVIVGDTAQVWTFTLNARDGEACDRHLELARVAGNGTWRVTRVLGIRRTQ